MLSRLKKKKKKKKNTPYLFCIL